MYKGNAFWRRVQHTPLHPYRPCPSFYTGACVVSPTLPHADTRFLRRWCVVRLRHTHRRGPLHIHFQNLSMCAISKSGAYRLAQYLNTHASLGDVLRQRDIFRVTSYEPRREAIPNGPVLQKPGW